MQSSKTAIALLPHWECTRWWRTSCSRDQRKFSINTRAQ